MVRNCIALVVATVVLVACGEPAPPDSATLLEDARMAMGAEDLSTIEFSGNGQDATTGQPWNINEGWPQWTVSDYNRVIDYDATASRQTAVREIADPMKLGGGGAQPGAAPQNQNSSVNENSGWTQRLQIWLTPHGFLRLAEQNEVAVTSEAMDGTTYNVASFSVTDGDQTYQFRGYFDPDSNLLEEIQTWIPDAILGDMLVEAEFGNYQDFGGVMFPGSYVHKHGGFDVLNLTVDNVVPNTTASAVPEQAAGGGRGGAGGRGGGGGRGGAGDAAAEAPPPYTEIGDGVFVIDGGYQATAVEFEDHAMIIEGFQNNNRVAELIALTRMAIPDKPIRYAVTTHAHWDHISGLREMVAEGVTIVVPEMDAAFFEEALNAPRTLEPDRAGELGATAMILGVADGHVFEDATQRVEMHKIQGSLHADDMMIAYIPSIQTIVEADLAQPWMGAFGGPGHPYLVHLADELDRIGLDYAQFVPTHRPTPGPTTSRDEFIAMARP